MMEGQRVDRAVSWEEWEGLARRFPWLCVAVRRGATRRPLQPALLPTLEIRTAYRNATPAGDSRPENQRAARLRSSLNLYLPSAATVIFSER